MKGKAEERMKRILALLAAAALLLTCCACTGRRGEDCGPGPREKEGERPAAEQNGNDVPAPQEGGEKESPPKEGPEEAGPPQEGPELPAWEEGARIGGPFVCDVMELNCLYAMSLDGLETVLLDDGGCIAFDHRGDLVVAGFEDGSIRQYRPGSGERRTLLQTGGRVSNVLISDSGVLYFGYTDSWESRGCYYSLVSGESFPLDYNYLYSACVVGDGMIFEETSYFSQEPYSRTDLVCYDLEKRSERWRVEELQNCRVDRYGDDVYLQYGYYEPGGYRLERVNPEDGSTEAIGTNGLQGFLMGRCVGSGGLYAETDYSDGFRPYFASEDGAADLSVYLPERDSYNLLVRDRSGDVLLMKDEEFMQDSVFEENDCWGYYGRYFLLDLSDGGVTMLSPRGVNANLFGNGDFPVLDSSTARKPVTSSVYSFFCVENGLQGAKPVCNTTHGAWLAIADRTSDVALLAAPTEEERSYLAERGVEVEMKLYGGDGLVFIAGTGCGVTDLTPDQIREIYSGRITNWKELGGADHPIRVLYRDPQSGSERLADSFLWKKVEKPDFEALGFDCLGEMSTIVSECQSDPYTIGYSIMTYLNDVYGEAGIVCCTLGGVAATPENVADGSYPFGTKGYVVIRADEAADSPARRLYDWFGSPVSGRLLTRCGVTPLTED